MLVAPRILQCFGLLWSALIRSALATAALAAAALVAADWAAAGFAAAYLAAADLASESALGCFRLVLNAQTSIKFAEILSEVC